MIAWLNFTVLLLSTLLTLVFYLKSVRPAALEQTIGTIAYEKCARYRMLAGLFMTIASVNYVLYVFFPLPIPLARTFPWPYWVSALIAVVILVPFGTLFAIGMRDAGEETMRPQKEHTLYGGIYRKIRHPQAIGELPLWWVFAFFCHSPFLVLYSIIWIPIFHWFCVAEERDLLLRYGASYQEYQAGTGMYFPKIRRF